MIRCRPLLAAIVLATCALAPPALARKSSDGLPVVSLSKLPKEAREVHALILTGGPFRYDRDGVVFGNRERLLPAKPRGHYYEYTVPTPGAKDRGPRRIVCGGAKTRPDACYYTDNHYQSFKRISE